MILYSNDIHSIRNCPWQVTIRVAAVRFGPVWRPFFPNPNPNLGPVWALQLNPEPLWGPVRFGSGSGHFGSWTGTEPEPPTSLGSSPVWVNLGPGPGLNPNPLRSGSCFSLWVGHKDNILYFK
jgi:hypothetical protein